MNSEAEDGSIVLEAALILPLFLTFVLALLAIIRIAIVSITIQSAVSETVKEVATHAYPIALIYQAYQESPTGQTLQQFLNDLEAGRKKIKQFEHASLQFNEVIPTPLLSILQWEQHTRTGTEKKVSDAYTREKNKAFTLLVNHYMEHHSFIASNNDLKVIEADIPDLVNHKNNYFELIVQYPLKLPIPFIKKTVMIRKKAIERVWIGE